MRLNESTVIVGDKVVLVPYRAEHVPTYHEWMKSPELLELTASEPLTYDEELEMQRKWHLDDDKLTFILLSRPHSHDDSQAQAGPSRPRTLSREQLAECKMIGDINLFLPDGLDGDGECEIMIASKEDRRNGYAIEALSLFLSYLTSTLPLRPTQLIARIGSSNTPSIQLFRKLGFGLIKHVQVFDEVELRFGEKDDLVLVDRLNLSSVPRTEWEKRVDWKDRIGVYDP